MKRKRRLLWRADTLPDGEGAPAAAPSQLKEAAWLTEAVKVKGLKQEGAEIISFSDRQVNSCSTV